MEPVAVLPPMRADEFSMSLEELQVAVARGCASGSGAWSSRCASGIRAALSFAAANPAAVRAMIDARAADAEGAESYRQLIDGFSAQLRECAPAQDRLPLSSDEAMIASIAGVVSGCLYLGGAERLEELAPYLIYLALLPYVGFEEAWRCSGLLE